MMNKALINQITRLNKPYYHLISDKPEKATKFKEIMNKHNKYYLTVMDVQNMRTLKNMHEEFIKTYKFPDYYGYNLGALDECINDLDWLGKVNGYATFLTNSEGIINIKNYDFNALVDVFDRAIKEWTEGRTYNPWFPTPPTPFHVVFQFSKVTAEEFEKRIREYGITEFDYLETKD